MTDNGANIIEELSHTPLLILSVNDQEIIDELNNVLPYSTGFEINACYKDTYNLYDFQAIPDIIYAGGSSGEQRYRIPNGIVGLICLYNISIQLKINCDLNPLSGIHYHVDCTDGFYKKITGSDILLNNADWIIEELDTWGYPGTYNSRGISGGGINNGHWLRTNELGTLEFRIGEMTFDYPLMLKRIRHINNIVKRIKLKIDPKHEPTFRPLDKIRQVEYQKNRLDASSQAMAHINTLEDRLRELEEQLKSKREQSLVEAQQGIQVRNRLHTIKTIFTNKD